jgi:hypothetical protein
MKTTPFWRFEKRKKIKMKLKLKLITLGIALILSMSAQAAPVTKILSLPFVVPAPGNYELTTTALASFVPVVNGSAITVPFYTGTTVIDMRGLTLNGANVEQHGIALQNSSNATVKNGTFQNFTDAAVSLVLNKGAVTLSELTFNNNVVGVSLLKVFSAVTVEECVFNGGVYGILDVLSNTGGEHFIDCSFSGQINNQSNQPIVFTGITFSPWVVSDFRVAPHPLTN